MIFLRGVANANQTHYEGSTENRTVMACTLGVGGQPSRVAWDLLWKKKKNPEQCPHPGEALRVLRGLAVLFGKYVSVASFLQCKG